MEAKKKSDAIYMRKTKSGNGIYLSNVPGGKLLFSSKKALLALLADEKEFIAFSAMPESEKSD